MKTNLDKLFKSDKNAEKNGQWFHIDEENGIAFKVKRFGGANSDAVKKKLATTYKPQALKIQKGTLSSDKENRLMTEIFVDTCVVDWKGIQDENGKEIEFSLENCKEMLYGLPELAKLLQEEASNFDNYKEDLGNS